MQFLAPHFLHLTWLVLLPLVLWLYRRQAKRVPVSTLLFFRALAREHQEAAWLRKLKRWLALTFTLAILLLAIFALAKPVRSGAKDAPSAVVILLDLSASMAAQDGGETRLAYAQKILRHQLLDLPDEVLVSLVTYGKRSDTRISRSRNRRELHRALESLHVSNEEDEALTALAAAQRLAALDAPAEIWHVSDSALPTAPTAGYRHLSAAMLSPLNAGITALSVRPAPLQRGKLEAFVQVQAATSNTKPVSATLELRLSGRMLGLRKLELAPGHSAPLLLPLEGGREGQVLEAEIKLPGDVLLVDNAAATPLPSQRPLTVAWYAEKPDPFTDLALSSLVESGRLEVFRQSPQSWPPSTQPEVFVFESWLPPELPKDRPALLLMPQQSCPQLRASPLKQPLSLPELRAVLPDHPVLYGLSTTRLALTQVSQVSLQSGLQALWLAGSEPQLIAGELQGQRLVITTFSPSLSPALAMLPQYPLLLGNALHWCTADTGSALPTLHTGDIMSLSEPLQWSSWEGGAFVSKEDTPLHGLHTLQRVGAFQTSSGKYGSCQLASAQETQLSARGVHEPVISSVTATSNSSLGWTGLLLWALLGLLVAESFLFHRRAMY
jgi:hypothetical protein